MIMICHQFKQKSNYDSDNLTNKYLIKTICLQCTAKSTSKTALLCQTFKHISSLVFSTEHYVVQKKEYLSTIQHKNKSKILIRKTLIHTRRPQKAINKSKKRMSVQQTFLRDCRRSFGLVTSAS